KLLIISNLHFLVIPLGVEPRTLRLRRMLYQLSNPRTKKARLPEGDRLESDPARATTFFVNH
ncbi:MAG TPA: hypothetical protein VJ951_13345, partial [Bacteroidales bacterium]|nr:hypothetical protein [Bacteroidales bacterium]